MDQPLSRLEAFAACAPGLERCLEQEMRALGLAEIQRVPGGVEFGADAARLGTAAGVAALTGARGVFAAGAAEAGASAVPYATASVRVNATPVRLPCLTLALR